MDTTSIPYSKGNLKVVERLANIGKIETYICRNEKGLFYCKSYPLPDCLSYFEKESNILKRLSSASITLPLIDSLKIASFGYIVFDHTSYSILNLHLPTLAFTDCEKLAKNLISIILTLHSLEIIHGNICIENLFIDSNFHIKITGFEFSVNSNEIEDPRTNGEIIENYQERDNKAPEMIENTTGSNENSDLWSLGCCLFRILTKDRPFANVADQRVGKFKDGLDGVWKLMIKRLLIVNPRLRANCKELDTLLKSSPPGETKPGASILNIFAKSTNSWVKNLTSDKDTSINHSMLTKLLTKAIQKPEKIPKFFDAIIRRPFDQPQIGIKSLIILHHYMIVLQLEELNSRVVEVLDSISSIWVSQSKSRQKVVSVTVKQVIVEYLNILKEKYRFHKEYQINCNWVHDGPIEEIRLRELENLNKSLIKFLEFVFSLKDFNEIYQDLIKIILSEQQQLSSLLLTKVLDTTNPQLAEEHMELNSKICAIVHQIYLKYPYMELSLAQITSKFTNIKLTEEKSPDSSLTRGLSSSSEYTFVLESDSIAVDDLEEPLELKHTDLEYLEIIGQGSSCTVYKGRYQGRLVAIKLMKQKSNRVAFLKEFNREIETLGALSHKNLVEYIGTCSGDQSCIVTEFCAGKTLFNLLHERRDIRLSWKQRTKFALDVAEAMAYLHSINPPIIHRDLKSLNLLLLDQINSDSDETTVKLTDFGVSRFVEDDVMTGHIGTCHWMAPEIIKGEQYGLSSDVYSFGIVLWEILARETPYRGLNTNAIPFQVINYGRRPELSVIPSDCPDELINIMKDSWETEPTKRPNFLEIVQRLSSIYSFY